MSSNEVYEIKVLKDEINKQKDLIKKLEKSKYDLIKALHTSNKRCKKLSDENNHFIDEYQYSIHETNENFLKQIQQIKKVKNDEIRHLQLEINMLKKN